MSASSFSNAPAWLNERCVVWQYSPWTALKQPHWAEGLALSRISSTERAAEYLSACLDKRQFELDPKTSKHLAKRMSFRTTKTQNAKAAPSTGLGIDVGQDK